MGVRQSQIRKKKRKPQIQNLCEKCENKLFEQKKNHLEKHQRSICGERVERERRDKLLLRDFIFLSSLNSGGSRIFFYGGSTVVELGICHEGQEKK